MAQDRLQQKVRLARLAIFAERVMPLMLRPCMVLGLALLLILTGLPELAGIRGRALFWAAAVAAFLISLWPLRRLRFPDAAEGLRRLETDSGLSFRPLSAITDKLAQGEAGLWAAHQARMAEKLKEVRLPRPRLSFAGTDPLALRNGLALALIAAFTLSGGGAWERIAASLPAAPQASLSVDGWVSPPAYTGQPPVVLAKGEAIASGALSVPEGSTIVMRVAGAGAELSFNGKPMALTGAKLPESGELVLSTRWRELGRWQLTLIPDSAPQARFTGKPEAKPTGQFSIPYAIHDDHGVTALALSFALSDAQEDGEGLAGAGAFLAEPPQVKVPLPANARKAEARLQAELAKHPWAGLYVEARLEARDAAGQEAASEPLRFKLPERQFRNLAARALAEQRQWLLRDPDNLPRVVAALDALTIYPDESLAPSGTWLTLRAITRKLYRATSVPGVNAAAEDLWNLAVALDGGSLANARQRLEDARRALEQALAEGASQEEIDRRLQELRQAMDEYLKAMAQAARRGELAQSPPEDGKPARTLSPEALSRMLDEMQKLSQRGERDAARDMLSALDQILKNLQMGKGQGSPQGQAMREMRDILRGQQQLMDRTFRMPEPGGQGAPQGEGGDALSREQSALARRLGELMGKLGDQGANVPDALGRAQQSMGKAGEALGAPDRNQALENQRQALSQLREGLDRLAREMMGEGQGEPSSQGPEGEARGSQDPLGRPQRAQGPDAGPDQNMVPEESRLEALRRILDELRRRSGEPGLSRVEREYFERLLRGLY